jgi:thiosulfate dehydrogenase
MSLEANDNVRKGLLLFFLVVLVLIIFWVFLLVILPKYYHHEDTVNETANFGSNSIVVERLKQLPKIKKPFWKAANTSLIEDSLLRVKVEYGKELIAHTAKFLGPNGTIAKLSNGMNCQNCHLDAGTAIFGNNYGSVASTYPKFRARSGSVEDIYKRINDCFERSLNGKSLDTNSNEMQAIKAYIEFIGSNVNKGEKAEGSGLKEMKYLGRAANPENGKLVYVTKCQSCHQKNGEGTLTVDKTEYTYPPLWGNQSYNDGAGLYRISNFAKYVKSNMPLGATHENPQLSDEEAWDVAAFVNAQIRPHKNASKDWPDISKKPIDHPFGAYADGFSEKQHKFGPFKPIQDYYEKKH